MDRMLTNLLALILIIVFLAGAAFATTYYVAPNGSDDEEHGTSCEMGFATIQYGIDSASNGDTVVICEGTYTGDGNRDLDTKGKSITITGTDPNDPDVVANTVINCQGAPQGKPPVPANNHRGFYIHSGEDNDCVIQGLTIRNGYVDKDNCIGGGILCENSYPTIRKCVIEACGAAGGGGLYIDNSYLEDDPNIVLISDCIIKNNFSTVGTSPGVNGAGINIVDAIVTIIDCTITGNSATGSPLTQHGGGIDCVWSLVTISRCTISDNSCGAIPPSPDCHSWTGGGIFAVGGVLNLDDCIISGNKAAAGGGGIFWQDTWKGNVAQYWYKATIKNCRIEDNNSNNSVNSKGAGIRIEWNASYTPTKLKLINCNITGNNADVQGGGVYSICEDNTEPNLGIFNCTIADNNAAGNPNGKNAYLDTYSRTIIKDSILWCDNNVPLYVENNATVDVSYSDIKGGWEGMGNISSDPGFKDPCNGDYHLEADSLCIDAGDPNEPTDPNIYNPYEPNEKDLDSEDRVANGDCKGGAVVDMGADEFAYYYIGDFDDECDVDFVDFAIMALYWLQNQPLVDIAPPPDGDGIVDVRDLKILCENWLAGK